MHSGLRGIMLVQHRMRLIVPGRGVPSLGGHDGEIPAGFFYRTWISGPTGVHNLSTKLFRQSLLATCIKASVSQRFSAKTTLDGFRHHNSLSNLQRETMRAMAVTQRCYKTPCPPTVSSRDGHRWCGMRLRWSVRTSPPICIPKRNAHPDFTHT